MRDRILVFVTLIVFVLFLNNCGGNSPIGPQQQEKGVISGTVTATDGRGGIQDALLKLNESDSVFQSVYSDVDGKFNFKRVDAGQYEVDLTLPQGFEKSGSGSKTVNVDGNVSINFQGEPIQQQTATIQQGTQDTLFTGSGAFISVDASTASSDIEVTMEEMVESGLAEDVETKPVRVWIRPPGAAKSSLSPAERMAKSTRNNLATSTNITFGQKVGATNTFSNGAAWFFDVGTEDEPLRLYAKASSETYVDPTTDKESKYFSHTFKSPHNANVELSLGLSHYWDETCSDDLRTLDPLPGDDGKKALILIHGIQLQKGNCSDFEDFKSVDLNDDDSDETFDLLVEKLRSVPEIDDNYKFYTYRYPTNASVIEAIDALELQIQQAEIQRPVLLAHSMGGLVGRAFVQEKGNNAIAGLITLGTPHQGTPIVQLALNLSEVAGTVIDLSINPLLASAGLLDTELLPNTPGLRDLDIESDLIIDLRNAKGDPRKIFTFGGSLENITSVSGRGFLDLGQIFTYQSGFKFMERLELKSDGLVPLSSATPKWSGLQTTLSGHDHTEMRSGNDLGTTISNSITEQIIPTLSVLAECEPPPERVESNDFNLSGSVARTDNQEVQVTLNSISIDGEIVTDLSADNITVVENSCVRPISDFSHDNVGVDIVFAQDMSGSMDNAISGVRSSVTEFSSDLSNRGINVRIGSIGYSGPGEIPSTPGPSPCEFIGPLQDLTDPNSFRDHVSNQWVATGGCDIPENALESIEYAQQEISWREGASRVFINITDASHHTNSTNCNDFGSCTDQSLSSLSSMVEDNSVIHAVADDSEYIRTSGGGADPWKLASLTGGENLVLPYDGYVDLTTIGITDVIGEASRFTFKSASPQEAIHTLRIRVEIDGKVAELAPDLVRYKRINSALSN